MALTHADLLQMLARGDATIVKCPGGRPPALPSPPPGLAADLLPKLRRLAQKHGWLGQETYNALGPDSGLQVILVREAVIFADVKDDGEPLTVQQDHWQHQLRATGQVEVVTWRPGDWPQIQQRLVQEGRP